MSQPWQVLRPRRARPPVWLVTFADLCVLLMAFFVLLLSLAEFDPARINLIRKAMDTAFRVPNDKAPGSDASRASQAQAEQLQRELDARLASKTACATETKALRKDRASLMFGDLSKCAKDCRGRGECLAAGCKCATGFTGLGCGIAI